MKPRDLRYLSATDSVITLTAARRVRLLQTRCNERAYRVFGLVPLDLDGTPHPNPNEWQCWDSTEQLGEVPASSVVLPAGTKFIVTGPHITYGTVKGPPGHFGARIRIAKDHVQNRMRNLNMWLTAKQLYALPEWPRK